MSLYPIKSVQKCSKCDDYFLYYSNTIDIPLELKCEACNNPYFKGFKFKEWFNTEKGHGE